MDAILAKLLEFGATALRKGTGAASFIFAEHAGRAVEVSADGGKWWIEFWAASDAEDAPPVDDAWVETVDDAVAAAIAWLR